jgi:uncharacterized protein
MEPIRIRDPIHGAIEVNALEREVIDSRAFRRLAGVKQLGFSDRAFPSATHSRFSHGLGAMHLATRLFDQALPPGGIPDDDRRRLRQATRLAALLHDLGHPPMSHASEVAMPAVGTLALDDWVSPSELSRRATHEDYTLALLLHSPLGELIEDRFGADGISPCMIAAIVSGRNPCAGDPFMAGGIDFFPLLRVFVSGEIDADRMDYLRRDASSCGVPYGQFDLDWLIEHTRFVVRDNQAFLAITKRAIFAFEDFLLSRYHMFISVYHHHVAICFDRMLAFYLTEAKDEYALPSDPETYLDYDDVHLEWALRHSGNRWARRIVSGDHFRRLVELNEFDRRPDLAPLLSELDAQGIEWFETESRSQVSTYFKKGSAFPLYVVMDGDAEPVPVTQYTPLFERYEQGVRLYRIYCHPDHLDRARPLAAHVVERESQPGLPLLGGAPRPSVVYRADASDPLPPRDDSRG